MDLLSLGNQWLLGKVKRRRWGRGRGRVKRVGGRRARGEHHHLYRHGCPDLVVINLVIGKARKSRGRNAGFYYFFSFHFVTTVSSDCIFIVVQVKA